MVIAGLEEDGKLDIVLFGEGLFCVFCCFFIAQLNLIPNPLHNSTANSAFLCYVLYLNYINELAFLTFLHSIES